MKDKDQVIEFVEQEVTKIQKKQEEERTQFAENQQLIHEQGREIDDLSRQNEVKNQEIKTLLEKMEQYKKHKDEQVAKLKESL